MVLNYYSKSVRNLLPEAAVDLLGKNKYICALEMFIKAMDWVFFSVFRHYFASISTDSSFSIKIMELVTLKSITLTDILDEIYCPCSAGLISNFEGYNMNSMHEGIKN